MAYLVLYINTQLSKGLVVPFWLENGVVAESLTTSFLSDDLTIHDAFESGYLSVYY
jgi:hypothetical protein